MCAMWYKGCGLLYQLILVFRETKKKKKNSRFEWGKNKKKKPDSVLYQREEMSILKRLMSK